MEQMEQSIITEWEIQNQHHIIGWEIQYGSEGYDIISFNMKDKSKVIFQRIKGVIE